ncbi:hypothetical protein [Geochorda subterranea]|uniref:Uncharacterized protein n=1 Tax=Geochorda subterranea TaxID=3109564 RepID=A0ABZ1BS08_9FIRM|nr:hypothetical protein [Limnochorda sp. LNt]WRP15305.1 hypothetical protein VLY81_03830 [Limnochorda sp. LNt]
MPSPKGPDFPDKIWLSWRQDGAYLVRDQHLVTRDDELVALSTVPIGRQMRGLCKLTLEELSAVVPPPVHTMARRVARSLVEGRPLRLVARDEQRAGHGPQEVLDGALALCRAGLVVVFLRNPRRASPQWELRHAELTNWGRAVLVSLDAVHLTGAGRLVPVSRQAVAVPAINGRAGKGTEPTERGDGDAARPTRS